MKRITDPLRHVGAALCLRNAPVVARVEIKGVLSLDGALDCSCPSMHRLGLLPSSTVGERYVQGPVMAVQRSLGTVGAGRQLIALAQTHQQGFSETATKQIEVEVEVEVGVRVGVWRLRSELGLGLGVGIEVRKGISRSGKAYA